MLPKRPEHLAQRGGARVVGVHRDDDLLRRFLAAVIGAVPGALAGHHAARERDAGIQAAGAGEAHDVGADRRRGGAFHPAAPLHEHAARVAAQLELVVHHGAQPRLGQDHHHHLAVLQPGLEAERAGPERVERRRGPRAAAVPRHQHAVAALAADQEAGAQHLRADHHRACLAQHALRVVAVHVVQHVLRGQGGPVHQRLLLGLRARRTHGGERRRRGYADGEHQAETRHDGIPPT